MRHTVCYKDPIGFKCTDSFWPLTCKKIQNGAHASVQIKTIIPLHVNPEFLKVTYSLTAHAA